METVRAKLWIVIMMQSGDFRAGRRLLRRTKLGLNVVPYLSESEYEMLVSLQNRKTSWWQKVSDAFQVLQLVAQALVVVLYYVLHCYVHLVYYTLTIVLDFRDSDRLMKFTLAITSATLLVTIFYLVFVLKREN